MKSRITKHLTYRNASILGWVGIALIIASFFLPAKSWQDFTVYTLGLTFCLINFAADYHRKGYIKGHQEARDIMTAAVNQFNFSAPPVASCPTRIMDRRNELRCWSPAGHEGDCK